METTGRVTRQTTKRLRENARSQALTKLDACFLVQVQQIVADFNVYNKESARKLLLKIHNSDEEESESEKAEIYEVDEVALSFDPFRDLHLQAMGTLHNLMENALRTQNILNSSSLRILVNSDTMTLEEFENIECPDYLWALNNFHPNYFQLDGTVDDIKTDVESKKTIFETHISELFSEYENVSTNSGSEVVPSTSTSFQALNY